MMTWRDVPGHEGAYEISDTGLVRSVARVVEARNGRRRRVAQRLLTPGVYKGNPVVWLARGGDEPKRAVTVGRLVAEAFVGPPPCPDARVYHRDSDARNNTPANVYWRPPCPTKTNPNPTCVRATSPAAPSCTTLSCG